MVVSGSAIGWYGLWQDETLTEFDGGKRCFTHRVCDTWEREARKAQRLGVRVVRLRIGLVLGIEGGMLSQYLMPFELGLGGPVGSGRQWMSWIERDDLVRLIAHVIATPSLTGPVNATAPAPVRNDEFARALGGALRRPALLRMPAAILHHLGGAFADELMLGGQRVIPDKALLSGFVFRYETLRSALDAMLGNASARPMPPGAERAQLRPNSRSISQPSRPPLGCCGRCVPADGCDIGGRRAVDGLLHDRCERRRRRLAGQGGDRDALVRAAHEAGPDIDRHAAAGGAARRRGVVIAEPDAGDEMGGVADEPGVAEILAGAGLAGGLPSRQLALAARCRRAWSRASSRSSSRRGAAR